MVEKGKGTNGDGERGVIRRREKQKRGRDEEGRR